MATELKGYYRNKRFLVDGQWTKQGADIRLAGGIVTNFPTAGDQIMPAGAVVVKEVGDGLYYLANGANGAGAGDLNTVASVVSSENPDDGWDLSVITWTVSYPSGQIHTGTVTLAADSDDAAKTIAVLNADVAFANHLVATDTTTVTISSRAKGQVHVLISSNNVGAYAVGGTPGEGLEANYLVTNEQRSLVGSGGASRTSDTVPTLLVGYFDETNLTGLTEEAKAVLERRGSKFITS